MFEDEFLVDIFNVGAFDWARTFLQEYIFEGSDLLIFELSEDNFAVKLLPFFSNPRNKIFFDLLNLLQKSFI